MERVYSEIVRDKSQTEDADLKNKFTKEDFIAKLQELQQSETAYFMNMLLNAKDVLSSTNPSQANQKDLYLATTLFLADIVEAAAGLSLRRRFGNGPVSWQHQAEIVDAGKLARAYFLNQELREGTITKESLLED